MRVAILGPNLRTTGETFHVHHPDCKDLARRPLYRGHEPYVVNVGNDVEVAEAIYDNGIMQEDETGADYLFDFKFFPCIDVPQHGSPTDSGKQSDRLEVDSMSTRTANAAAKTTGRKRTSSKPKTAPARTRQASEPKGRTRKSVSVILTNAEPKKNSVQFKPKGVKNPLITGAYVRNEVLALLDGGQKTVDLGTFTRHETDPKNSVRFNEHGDVKGLGAVYLMNKAIEGTAIAAAAQVKVRVERSGPGGVKITVTAA